MIRQQRKPHQLAWIVLGPLLFVIVGMAWLTVSEKEFVVSEAPFVTAEEVLP